jgi:multidrug efflux pump subunit AcrB
LRVRWILVPTYLLVAAAGIYFVGRQLGTGIFPCSDSPDVRIRLRAPAGTDLDGTERVALRVLDVIKATVGETNVQSSLGLLGVHGASYPINLLHIWNGGTEEGVLQVKLSQRASLRGEALHEQLRREFAAKLPEVEFFCEPADIVSRVMSLNIAAPVEVTVGGLNLAANRAHAEKVQARLAQLTSLRDVQFAQSLDYPTVEVTVNRERAGIIGASMADVSRALVPATSSSRFTVPNFWADPNSGVAYQVQVQIQQELTSSTEELENLPVLERDGEPVLLRNLARITTGTAMSQHDRYNMERLIAVRANVAGADLGGAIRDVRQVLADLGPAPAGVNVTLRGQAGPLREMQSGLQRGLLLAIAATFLLLTAHFQSVKLAAIVVSTVPAVLVGVVLALAGTGTTLNLQSFMGAIMAVGVAVANAILLVTFAERERMAGAIALDAALRGANSRLRAILMTSCAMLAGMLPTALGFGESAGQTAPLGRAVVGGLVAATVATLFIVPAVFALVQSRAHRRSASLEVSAAILTGEQTT